MRCWDSDWSPDALLCPPVRPACRQPSPHCKLLQLGKPGLPLAPARWGPTELVSPSHGLQAGVSWASAGCAVGVWVRSHGLACEASKPHPAGTYCWSPRSPAPTLHFEVSSASPAEAGAGTAPGSGWSISRHECSLSAPSQGDTGLCREKAALFLPLILSCLLHASSA